VRSAQVAEARAGELAALAVRKYLDALCVYFWAATPLLQARARAAARVERCCAVQLPRHAPATMEGPGDGAKASRSVPAAERRLASADKSNALAVVGHTRALLQRNVSQRAHRVVLKYVIISSRQNTALLALRTGAADVWRVCAAGPAADGARRVHVARAVRRADRAAQLLPVGHQRLHRGSRVRAPPAAVRPGRRACQPATSRCCSGMQRCAPGAAPASPPPAGSAQDCSGAAQAPRLGAYRPAAGGCCSKPGGG